MKFLLAAAFHLVLITGVTAQKQEPPRPLSIGEIRTLHSNILGEDRILNICLPAQYNADTAYPVIYLLDGSYNEDLIHICGLVQFFNLQFNMPDHIIVGIANVDRKRDFTFHTEIEELRKSYPTTGHSDKFIRFIAEELQPYVDKNFRTTPVRYLLGQSLGGLLATEILLKNASLFTHYLIVSPSLWWDDESLLQQAGTLAGKQDLSNCYVYVSVGKGEAKIMRKEAKKLYEVLQKTRKKPRKSNFNLMQKENHATILHRSIYEAFLNLYPGGE